LTTALRKSTNCRGLKPTSQEVASWSYLEFSTGRSANRYDEEKELKNRTSKTVKMEHMSLSMGDFDEIVHKIV